MQLAIDISIGKVLAKYNDGQHIDMSQYGEDVELVPWSRTFSMALTEDGELPDDPRDAGTREAYRRDEHLRRRRRARPPVQDCLDMIYRDMRDGTMTFVEAMQDIEVRFPPRRETE